MRENRPYGSVRGVPGDRRPYRDPGKPRLAAPEGGSVCKTPAKRDAMRRILSENSEQSTLMLAGTSLLLPFLCALCAL